MKSLALSLLALLFSSSAFAQCASGYTQNNSVFACQQNAGSAPVINSPTTATGTVGTAFSYQITATNSPTSFTASPLPSPLTVNSSGLISGTPTATSSTTVALGATNASGTGTQNLALTISAGPSNFNVGYVITPTNTAGTINDTAGTVAGSGPFTMSATGAVQSISMYIGVPAGASEYFGVFADNAGAPGALIAQTTLHAMVAGWNTFSTATNPTVNSGSKIWIMKLPPTGTPLGSSPSDTTSANYTWIDGARTVFPSTLTGIGQHPYTNLTFGAYATFH